MRYSLVEPYNGDDETSVIQWWWTILVALITLVIFGCIILLIYCLCLYLKTRNNNENSRIFQIKQSRKYTNRGKELEMERFNKPTRESAANSTVYHSINEGDTVYNLL